MYNRFHFSVLKMRVFTANTTKTDIIEEDVIQDTENVIIFDIILCRDQLICEFTD